jgi:Flp pilus assembly protein TadD
MHRQWVVLLVIFLASGSELGAESRQPEPEPSAAYELAVAKLLIAEHRLQEALSSLRRATDLEPGEPYLRAELSALLRRLGQWQAAETEILHALALSPGNTELLEEAGEVYLALSERDGSYLGQAEEIFGQLVEARPTDLQSLHLLGRLRQRSGDLEGAEEMFRRMLELRPELRTTSAALLQVLLEQGKLAEASELLRFTLARRPGDLEGRLTLSDLLSEQGEHAAAVEVLREAPGDDRNHPELMRRLALELYRSGDVDQGVLVMDQVVDTHPLPGLRLLRALLVAQSGDMQRAREELVALQRDLPGDPEVAMALAEVQVRLDLVSEARETTAELASRLQRNGDPERAEEAALELTRLLVAGRHWDEALEEATALRQARSPAVRTEAVLVRAEALLGLERAQEALFELDSLESANGGPQVEARRAEALFRLGRQRQAQRVMRQLGERPEERRLVVEVYQRAERYEEAIPVLVELLDESPSAVDLRFWLGAAYERTGHYNEAETTFRALLEQRPDFHLALNYLGYMWADQGENLEEALKLIQRAVELEPDNGAYVDSLGWVYFRLGRTEEARVKLERAAELMPEDATVLEHLGDVLHALGKLDGARDAYRRALVAEPESEVVRIKLRLVDEELGDGEGP